jgi:hypothetical protein
MLTYHDEPTIRFAIERRLSKEPGVTHLEIHVKPRLFDVPRISVLVSGRSSGRRSRTSKAASISRRNSSTAEIAQ